ncbi:PTS sugar transporter subunit IIA [Bacillus sp. SL00103]
MTSFLELEQPIEWGSFDDLPTSCLFTLLVPLEEANVTHLKLLSGIATSLMEPAFIEKIQPGQTTNYYYEVIEQQLKRGDYTMKIVGVTSCPAGLAHTPMAAKALENAGKQLGHEIKIGGKGLWDR